MNSTKNKNESQVKIKQMIWLILLCCLFVSIARAQTTAFTYQGRLNDGTIRANRDYDFQFSLFKVATGGVQIDSAQTVTGVSVVDGIFTVELNFGTDTVFDGTERFLEIAVKRPSDSTYTTLAPRQPLTSAPYGIRSIKASQAADSTNLGGQPASSYALTTDPRFNDSRNPLAGSPNYIQNQNSTPQPSTTFSISGDGTLGGTLSANRINSASQYDINGNRVLGTALFSTFVGNGAGQSNVTASGTSNSFFGYNAGSANGTGNNNAYFGTLAGAANVNGFQNSFFGTGAGGTSTGGAVNSFFGFRAGYTNTTGNSNSFVGAYAGSANTSGTRNSFFGENSGWSNTVGSDNSFFGRTSGHDNTEGNQNSFFGVSAGYRNTTGTGNSFFGYHAGFGALGAAGADYNSFFGVNAGINDSTGANNSFFGANAGNDNTTGSYNTFIGRNAGQSNTSGSNNTFIGSNTGTGNTTGSNNTFIGFNSRASSGVFNSVAIGANAVATESNVVQLGGSGVSTRVGGALTVSGNGSSGLSVTGSTLITGSAQVTGTLAVGGIMQANSDLYVNGTLTKAAGSFKIDHPLDPKNKYLSHSFVESPDMMNVYNGNVTTNKKGEAVVRLPDYFEALNRDFRYQLTVIGKFAQAIIAEKIKGNSFKIKTDKPNVEVSWQVTGIRQDKFANENRIPTEVEKTEAERGAYLKSQSPKKEK